MWSRIPAFLAMGGLLIGALTLPSGSVAAASTRHAVARGRLRAAGAGPHGRPQAGVAGRSRVAPTALLNHSTRAGKHAAVRSGPLASAGATGLGAPLPLDSLPLGTYVTNQFAKDGIVFSGQSPFITDDGSSSVNPTLSGSPLFQGTIVGTFVKPGTQTPATVNDFSISVGYIDNPGSTQMTVYNLQGKQLGVLVATQVGFNQLYSTFPGAASFSVSSVADEPAGWEMNTIQVGPINTNYIAMGDSYSSGEGTYDFPWSQGQGTQCDTGPEAWPVQMAAAQNGNSTGATLTIDQNTLVACQGEQSSQLGVPVNNESVSELGQVTNFVKNNGPPDLVTITIGGNDLGFADILKACFLGGTEVCLHIVNSLDNKVTTGASSLIATLAGTYSEVESAADSGAAGGGSGPQVVVVGYPDLFPQPGGLGTALSVTYNCPWLRESLYPLIDLPVSPFVNTLLGNLASAQAAINDDMAAAAAEAGVQFIPIPDSLSGHELCTGSPYINPLTLYKGATGDRNIGHPTVAGQAAIASAVGSELGLGTSGAGGGDGPRAGLAAPARGHRVHLPVNGGALSFPGAQLADGTAGADYADYLVSTGGTGADTWSVTSGSLPPGLSLDSDAGTITGTPTAAGSYTFTAQVSDSSSPAQTASAPVTIKVAAATALAVGATTPPDATAGQPYTVQLSATGGLGAVSWAVTSGSLPAGLQLNGATGQLTGTPTAAGSSTFSVQATDSSSPAQVATGSESITVHPSSAPLTITTTSLPEIAAGQDYAGQLASTGGVAPIQWSVSAGSLPPGLSLDPANGTLSGTPTAAGTYDFTAQVSDATSPASQTATAQESITIDAPPALSISTTDAFDGVEGSYYSSTLQATGGVGSYQWSVSSGSLPAGLSLDPSTGQITGIPSTTGDSSFGVTVSDAAGATATQSYSVTIATVPLTVSSALAPATVGTYYTGNVTPAGGQAPYGWSLVSGTLPSGLTFDPSTGAITGTPTQSGSFPLQVSVTDSSSPSQQVTAKVTLTVAAAAKLQVSSRAPVAGAVGTPYTTGIGYVGGQGPYTWAVTAGTLPPGLTLDPGSGMVVGTPTTSGSYPVTVQVTDSTTPAAEVATASLTFTVGSTPKLAVTAATLPQATQGTTYADALQATGGVAPYTWSVASGTLPAGLSLDPSSGEITGTPTGVGTKGFTVGVSDSQSTPATATRYLKLTVDTGAPLSIATTSLADGAQGSFYEEPLTASGGVGPYTWSVLHGPLPGGLSLDPSGYLDGTPTHFGSFTFTLKATDQATPKAGVASQTLSLNITAMPVSPPSLVADSPTSPVGVGAPYSYEFAATGNPAPTFSVSSGSLPPGLKLARTTGLLSGTTTRAGTYTFQITATNGRTPDAVTPDLQITVVPAPVITTVTPTEAVPGASVVITGKNLENAYVYFDGSYATLTSDTASRIATTVPEYAGTGPIYVDTAGGSVASSQTFTVDPPPLPTITSISPTSASAGKTLTITGTGLEFASEVDFNGAEVYSFYSDKTTTLTLRIPSGISAGPVTVYTQGGSATSTQTFTPTG